MSCGIVTELHRSESDLRLAVRGETGKITRIASENKRSSVLRSKGHDDGVGHRYRGRAPRLCTHTCGDPGERLGDVPDLAQLEQPVHVEVSALVSREYLRQNDRWHMGRPEPTISKRSQAFRPAQ